LLVENSIGIFPQEKVFSSSSAVNLWKISRTCRTSIT
jgi:hypothetical protein